MAVQLIAHPFAIGAGGAVETHEQDSDAYLAGRIALLVGCRPGERPLVPTFGINDPAFGGVTLASIQNQVAVYGLPVTITGVSKAVLNDSTTQYRITFERKEDQA